MEKKRKDIMDNQNIDTNGTYGQSEYSRQKLILLEVISSSKNLKNFKFEEDVNFKPTMLLLESIMKAQKDRKQGRASPIFSSVS